MRSAQPSRRSFLSSLAVASTTALPSTCASAAQDPMEPVRRLIHQTVPKREWIDAFLDPKAPVWAQFDPELGYTLRNYFMRDGAYGSHTLCRFEPTGERLRVNFPDQPCRIHSYGDSFTQGHQVSDGETWQEVLSAHFCEPIRNFGIGGYGVYQAYRRLLRHEAKTPEATHLIFNIWGDDHLRSIYPWRALSFPPDVNARAVGGTMFHSNPWVHAHLDPASGQLLEKPNACPTPDSLYQLCNPEFAYETFKHDPVVRCLAAIHLKDGETIDTDPLQQMAHTIQLPNLDWSTSSATRASATKLLHDYAIQVGIKIMDKLQDWCTRNHKQLLILLSYPQGSVWHACMGHSPGSDGNVDWHPRVFQDFLAKRHIPCVDSLPKHVAEFQSMNMDPKAYVDRYYIGHYNPTGNHFFAFAIRDDLLRWLDPKPPAYRGRDQDTLIRFQGYLPG